MKSSGTGCISLCMRSLLGRWTQTLKKYLTSVILRRVGIMLESCTQGALTLMSPKGRAPAEKRIRFWMNAMRALLATEARQI